MTEILAGIKEPQIPDTIAQILVTPADYASDSIQEAYRWIRKNTPLGLAKPRGFDPFWVVSKHEDILHISRNNELFPSGERATTLGDQAHISRVKALTGTPNLLRTLIQMDGAEHRDYRGLTRSWFLPKNVQQLHGAINQIAKDSLDHMASLNGQCDFVKDVALEYPLKVVMSILGLPSQEYPRMLRLTQELFGPQDPEMSRNAGTEKPVHYSKGVQGTVQEFAEFFKKVSEDRRKAPRDDLASLIANAQINGQPIGEREAASYYMIVATAGHDTTSYSVSMAMWALVNSPGLLQELKGDPSLIPAFVEESIRWATPVKTFMRSAREDVEIRGQKIRKGDWLMLCYASGNRDEEVFSEPFKFDIHRKPNPQLAFGYGGHFCLGQHLARFEMRAFFEQLIARVEHVASNGEATSVHSWFVNGLKSLPIVYQMS